MIVFIKKKQGVMLFTGGNRPRQKNRIFINMYITIMINDNASPLTEGAVSLSNEVISNTLTTSRLLDSVRESVKNIKRLRSY